MFAVLRNPGFILDALYLHLVRKRAAYSAAAVCLVILAALSYLLVPATSFPKGAMLIVPEDATFRDTANLLEEQGIIGSGVAFRALARITLSDRSVRSGKYLFTEPQGMLLVLWRLSRGDSGIPSIRVTFPEGVTVREMADILSDRIPALDTDAFVAAASPYEGYLFPDTYEFYADSSPAEIVARMRDRYAEVWVEVLKESREGGQDGLVLVSEPQDSIVIMASILEKETKPGHDRHLVSGILWNRIEEGMGLQVDAVFGYIKGIDTYHPSGEDLEIDSPYNTYKYRDLPPGAIGNPGKDALLSAMRPAPSSFFYYLTGDDGKMYYALTFDEHKENKEKYLR